MTAAKDQAEKIERKDCPVCGNAMRSRFRKFGHAFFQCRDCRFGCFQPIPNSEDILRRYTNAYFRNEYLQSYGASWDQFNMDVIRRRFAYIAERFLSRCVLPEGEKTVLDVGCGGGFLLKCFQEQGWRTHGVDIIASSVQYSRERLGVPAVQADFEKADPETLFPSGEKFTVVTLTDALEHFFNPRKVLEKTYRMLKPGGVVFVSVPNIESICMRYLGKQWAIVSPLEHISYFSPSSLKLMLAQAGFSHIQTQVLQYVNVANVHRRTLRVRLGRYLVFLVSRTYGIAFEGREAYDDILSQGYFKSAEEPGPRGDVLVAIGQKTHE